jgi:uncharacterized protein YndB with AHSA1/START domain
MKGSIRRELRFPQSRDAVWEALTDPEALAEWMFPNDFEAREGHRFAFRVPPKPEIEFEGLEVRGEVLRCRPPEELTFSWIAGEVDTRISYRLEADGTGTRMFFEQTGFEQPYALKGAEYGWTMMHEKLAGLLAGASPA